MNSIGCARPGCIKPLNTGKEYCSTSCAAQDRSRVKDARQTRLSGEAQSLIPQSIANVMVTRLGDDAYAIMDEWAITLAENKELVPPLLSYKTEGGDLDPYRYGILAIDNGTYRADDALGYDTIDQMLKNGQVQFGMAMKESWLLSVFRNSRSFDVECKDEKLKEIVEAMAKRVFQRHSADFTKAIAYGSYFGEKIWDFQPAVRWGLDGNEKIYGYKSIDAIHPKSIERIRYGAKGRHFNGFVQQPTYGPEISVNTDLALVLTYDKRFRNLWGISALEPVYAFWFWYEIALRSFLRYLERMGTPVTVAYAPSRGQIRQPDGTLTNTMKYAFLMASNVAKSNAIALPSDRDPDTNQPLWDLKYLVDDKRGAQFVEAINMLGDMIIRAMVIGDRAASQSSETGSYAAAAVHFAVTMLHNEHILQQFLNQLNSYMVPQIGLYNIGANAPPAQIVTEGLDPAEKDRLFKLLSTMGNQPGNLSMDWIDWQAIFRVENIPVLEQEDYDALQKEKEERADQAMERQQKLAPPKPGEKQEGPGKKPSEEKVKASADWVLYNMAMGAKMPLMLSQEQAMEIAERHQPRPFAIALDEGGLAEDGKDCTIEERGHSAEQDNGD